MENPKLALIPSGYKSGKVYSILPVNGVGDFDFSRNTESSRVNKEGLIETVSNNVPKLDWLNSDCPSLLLEPQRTNEFTYSEEFNQSVWFKSNSTITTNEITAPDGTMTADLLTSNASGGGVFRFNGWSTTQKTNSIFVKKNSSSTAEIFNASSGANRVVFNLDNGTITTQGGSMTGQIQNFGSGWFRISATHTATGNQTFGLKPETNQSLFIWGCQSESASHPTSYIKTTGIAETRFKDECNNAGDSQLLNNSENTFFIDLNKIYKTGTGDSRISLNDGSATNRVLFSTQTNDTTIILYSIRNNVTTTVKYFSVDYDARNKIAYTFKDNEIKFYVNGEKIHEALFLPIPLNLSKISFDENNGSSRAFQGEVNEIRYYDRVLTEAEAIKLTK